MVTKAKFSSNVSDPVADLLTRIRNANLAYKDDLVAPVSKLGESILKILATEGFIDGFDREGEGLDAAFRIRLKYGKGRPRVLGVLGIAIVSTSQGVMTDKDASRKGIGGEVLAYVW
jgi:small subunit ribosomal protein S8